jgi:hypothetical protein
MLPSKVDQNKKPDAFAIRQTVWFVSAGYKNSRLEYRVNNRQGIVGNGLRSHAETAYYHRR